MTAHIKFCGAAGTVTGSCYWIRGETFSFLIDCGMYQGSKTLKALNYEEFPFDPRNIDFVLLTHAHIDHSGLIPKLIRQGFGGPVYATNGTRDLVEFMWPDSGYIHETEVRFLNRRRQQHGLDVVSPIYTQSEAEASLSQLRTVEYDDWFEPCKGIRARYWNAGHILGSASIELELDDASREEGPVRLLFSGDIGPDYKLFHPDPEGPKNIDYLICESTYGDRERRLYSPDERRERLREAISNAIGEGEGVLVIPAFSVERTQELLIDIGILLKAGKIPDSLVFLDSPLAIRATETFARHAADLEDVPDAKGFLAHENFVAIRSVDESKQINNYKNNIIIIAASGMCEAGRIRHHLKRRLWSPEATIMIVGYQAPGTLGALLLEGKKAVRIQGETVKVNARITELDIYSGHADARGLEEWVLERLPVRGGAFLTHGEPAALAALKDRLINAGLSADLMIVPELDDEFALTPRRAAKAKTPRKRRLEPGAAARLDWHNDLAQLSMDISDELEAAADEKSRQKILRRLRRALENDADDR